MFEMLCGRPPFEGANHDDLFDKIITEEALYPVWISLQAKSLLVQLLMKDPSQRYVREKLVHFVEKTFTECYINLIDGCGMPKITWRKLSTVA
jgi:serine/threonine protein kinase